MAYPALSQLSCEFGAPMGRRSYIKPREDSGKLYVRLLPFVDGCYDKGGAYWGSPANLYRAVTSDCEVEIFVRANSREDAKNQVLKVYPSAEFFK